MKIGKDEVMMRVGNGSKVDVIAVGTLPLHLPSGLVLDLKYCYLVPVLSMNIFDHVYCNTIIHLSKRINYCSVYMNRTLYGYTPNEK